MLLFKHSAGVQFGLHMQAALSQKPTSVRPSSAAPRGLLLSAGTKQKGHLLVYLFSRFCLEGELLQSQARIRERWRKDMRTGHEGQLVFEHLVLAGGQHGWGAAAAALNLRPGQVYSTAAAVK